MGQIDDSHTMYLEGYSMMSSISIFRTGFQLGLKRSRFYP